MLRRLLPHRRGQATFGLLVGLNFFAAVLEAFVIVLVAPLATSIASDSDATISPVGPFFSDASSERLLVFAIVGVLGFWIMRVVAVWAQAGLVARVETEARTGIYDSLLATSFEFRESLDPGYLHGVSGWTSSRANQLGRLVNVMAYGLNLAVMIGGAFLVEPAAAIVIALAGVVLGLVFRPLINRSRQLAALVATEGARSAAHLSETETLDLEVELYDAAPWASKTWAGLAGALVDARRKNTIIGGVIRPTYQASALLVAFTALGFAVLSGGVNVPALGAVALLLLRSLSYGQALQTTLQRLADTGSVDELLRTEFDRQADARRDYGDTLLLDLNEVKLNEVSYSYPGSDAAALDSIDLRISRGERVGIVGPSGAGKSTLAQLLLRLREPTSGMICLDGHDSAEYEPSSWSRAIGFVPQSSALFGGTVRENVTLFRENITDVDVRDALTRAGLLDVVEALPRGLDTQIGGADRALSGGQVQRLGIARALAARPAMVVLDEPTSALDVDSEALITSTLDELPEDDIVIVIAHRISTLRACDRILVVEDGKITADGPPEQVMQGNDFYARAAL